MISKNHQLTPEQKEELDKRFNDHENGIGIIYTWEETIAMTNQALANRKTNPVNVTEGQIQMLQLTDDDIKAGRVISQEQAEKDDLEWLKTLKN